MLTEVTLDLLLSGFLQDTQVSGRYWRGMSSCPFLLATPSVVQVETAHRVLLVHQGAFSPRRCSFPGGGCGQGHPGVLEINAGHLVRPAHEGKQGLSGHSSSNSDGGSICVVASSISANEGATWLLVNEGCFFCLAPSLPRIRCLAGGGRFPATLIPSLTPLAPTCLSPRGSRIFHLCI